MLYQRTTDVLPYGESSSSAKTGERLQVPDYAAAYYVQDRSNLLNVLTQFTTVKITADLEARPDLISYRYYGTPNLYWLLCMYNGVIFPQEDIVAGMEFKIPDANQVNNYLSTLSVRKFKTRVGQLLRF